MSRSRFFYMALVWLLSTVAAGASAPVSGARGDYRPRLNNAHLRTDSYRTAARRSEEQPSGHFADRGLILLVEFTDESFQPHNTPAAFDSLLNAEEYIYNGSCGSARAYFRAQSNGAYVPRFDVVGPVKLPHSVAYYGTDAQDGTDRYTADFVMDACAAADAMGVDFTKYNQNGDSLIDFVFFIYAGVGQADGGPASTIWPHAWELESALGYGYTNQTEYFVDYDFEADTIRSEHLPKYDGLYLCSYACSNELKYSPRVRGGVGTFCHEFSHVLGLPDYYITLPDARQPDNSAPGNWSLMSHGNYNNNGNTPPNYSCYDKYFLGWITPSSLPASGWDSLRVGECRMVTCHDTVYILENRQYEGWDAHLPGHGLLVWQVVYDEWSWINNEVNNTTTRYKLLSASGRDAYTVSHRRGTREDVPFPGKYNVTDLSIGSSVVLNRITERDGVVSFYVMPVSTGTPTVPSAGPMVRKVLRNGLFMIEYKTNDYEYYQDALGRVISH